VTSISRLFLDIGVGENFTPIQIEVVDVRVGESGLIAEVLEPRCEPVARDTMLNLNYLNL